MIYLAQHIEYLLLRHDCVIMPGIGAFINVYKPAAYDAETHRMLPTRREIIFNGSLKTDDGLLANSYARKEDISHREGSERLGRSLMAVANALNTDGEVTFGRLGTLTKGEEGNLFFHPFGNARQRADKEGYFEISLPGEEPEYAEKIRRMNFDKNYYIPVNKFATKICASLFVVFLLTIMWIVPAGRLSDREERASVVPLDRIIDTAVKKSASSITELCVDSSSSPAAMEVELKEEEPAAEEIPTLKYDDIKEEVYYLIVATSTTTQEAMRYARMFQSDDYRMQVVESPRVSRVAALSSTDRQQLVDTMRSADFKSRFREAWIWSKK